MANAQQRELLIRGAWENGLVRFSPVRAEANYNAIKLPIVLSAGGGVLAASGLVGGVVGLICFAGPWLLVPILAGKSSRKLFTSVRQSAAQKDSMHLGVVIANHVDRAPASGRECLAYSIRLRHKETKSDTLIDSYSTGFDVKLSDDRVAHIPKGRIRIDGDLNMQSLPATTDMTEWWQLVDPLRVPDERMPPYPHNQVDEVVLEAGQHVVLQNEMMMTTRQHRGADYRDASANVLEPRGVPFIRLV